MFPAVLGGLWNFRGSGRGKESSSGGGPPAGFDPKNWQPPDGLGYSRLRPTSLTGSGIALAVFAALMIAGGLIGAVAASRAAKREAARNSQLQNQGDLAQATITRLWRSAGKDQQHFVGYSFTDPRGSVYQAHVKAPSGIWRSLKEGASLPVRFLPSDPTVSHPEGWAAQEIPKFVPYFIALSAAFPTLLLLALLRRQMRLLSEGRPAPGFITRHGRADHGKTRNYYQFILLSGATAKGRADSRRPLPMNTPICILYDPDNPRRNAPYPLSLVKLADIRR